MPDLQPTRYHREVVALLRELEPEVWTWAASADAASGEAERVRSDLLRAAYRLDAEGHGDLIERAAAVASRLGVTSPVTLYQAQSGGGGGMNAALCHLPGEAHVLFMGPVLETLEGAELDALLAHELAHHLLWERDGGAYLVADRLLRGAASDPRGSHAHRLTASRITLATEIFADRGSLVGSGSLEAAVTALVKTETGLARVSAASYLRQADEILAEGAEPDPDREHPETFVRARALRLWSEDDPGLDAFLSATLEGPRSMEALDLVGQRDVSRLTRRFLGELLRPAWFRSELAMSHARQFFADFAPAAAADPALDAELQSLAPSVRDYLCWLLLDFASVDPELDDAPLAAALAWSAKLGAVEQVEKLAVQELRLTKRTLTRLKKEGAALLARAEA